MDPNLPEDVEPENLRFLRLLVTVLTATMIVGLLVIIVLFVIRFSGNDLNVPDHVTLPDGATASSFTVGDGWYAVVTTDNRILIFDRDTGELRQTVDIH